MEVIVEHKVTGARKTMTKLMATHLSSKYRIVEAKKDAPQTLEKSPAFVPEVKPKTELEQLRAEYTEIFKQAPHHALREAKLRLLIDEQKNKAQ